MATRRPPPVDLGGIDDRQRGRDGRDGAAGATGAQGPRGPAGQTNVSGVLPIKVGTGNIIEIDPATTSARGTMSAADKVKVDAIAADIVAAIAAHIAAADPHTQYAQEADVTAALALKAALASPAFTGNPTAPTPSVGDNDTSIATTAFVATAVAAGSGKLNPRYEAYFCEDYLRGGGVSSTNNGTNFIQSDSAITYVSGTGAGPSFTASVGRPGQLALSTGTSVNGYSRHFVSGGLRYKFGGGVINVGTTIVLSNLSNSGQRYQLAFGFFDVISGATNNRVDAVYQDDINSGNWRLRAINGGVTTDVDTATVGPAAGVETRVELEINAAGTLATLRIDGTSVATVALSNSATMGLGLAISKSIGNSAVTVTPNYIEFGQVYTNPM